MVGRNVVRVGVALLLSVTLVGCIIGVSPSDAPTLQPAAEGSLSVPDPTPSPTPVLSDVVRNPTDAGRFAREDLAERLGVDTTEIEVLKVSRTELPARQLEQEEDKRKPAPPAELLGYEVKLRFGDVEYLYHVRLRQLTLVGSRQADKASE